MKNKKNILIYTTSDFPNGGAAENFVRQMAIGLSENNANVSIVRLKGQLKEGVNVTIMIITFIFCFKIKI